MKALFGNISFGDFVICGDEYPIALVSEHTEVEVKNEEEAETIMETGKWDAYVIPELFNGEVYFSKKGSGADE